MARVAWVGVFACAVAACAPVTPHRVREYNEDGVRLYENGSFADARDSFQAALDLKPGDPDLTFNLARCHDQLGQPGRAEALYRQCLQSSPDHAECRHALTALLVRADRRAEAVQFVDGWMRRAPNSSGPYAEDAWLKAQEGDRPSAQARLQQALALNPRDNRALVELARLYESGGRPDRALVLYERALEVNPRQPDVARRVRELRAGGTTLPHPD
jgi:protein O-GlcNAc transferase